MTFEAVLISLTELVREEFEVYGRRPVALELLVAYPAT